MRGPGLSLRWRAGRSTLGPLGLAVALAFGVCGGVRQAAFRSRRRPPARAAGACHPLVPQRQHRPGHGLAGRGARPVSVAPDRHGAWLVADDVGNVIWRVIARAWAP